MQGNKIIYAKILKQVQGNIVCPLKSLHFSKSYKKLLVVTEFGLWKTYSKRESCFSAIKNFS